MPDITHLLPAEDKPYVDLETALGRVRGNTTIYRKMLDLFLKSGEFASFEDSLAAGDWQKASEVAHGIKGMTGNLGLDKLSAASAELMVKLREGPADPALVDDYRATLEKTKEVVQKVADAIDAG